MAIVVVLLVQSMENPRPANGSKGDLRVCRPPPPPPPPLANIDPGVVVGPPARCYWVAVVLAAIVRTEVTCMYLPAGLLCPALSRLGTFGVLVLRCWRGARACSCEDPL
jgi:hypothetical protein